MEAGAARHLANFWNEFLLGRFLLGEMSLSSQSPQQISHGRPYCLAQVKVNQFQKAKVNQMNPKSFPKNVLLCVTSAMLGSVTTFYLFSREVRVSGNSGNSIPVIAKGKTSGSPARADGGNEPEELPVRSGQKFFLNSEIPTSGQMVIVETKGNWAKVKFTDSKMNGGNSLWINFEQIPSLVTSD